jgi:hypothetical protein
MAKNGIVTPYDDNGYPGVAAFTATVAAGAGTTVIKGAPGRLCRVVVTAGGTASDNITIYDNASAGSGTPLAVIPGGGAAGQIFTLDLPAVNGITAVNVASGPAATIGYC